MLTVLTNYYQRNHSKQLQITTRKIIEYNTYKLLSEKSFQTIFTNYILPGRSNNTYKLLSEKSFQAILTNCYQTNYSKQFLHSTTREIESYIQTFIRKTFQTKLTNYYLRNHSTFTNYYQLNRMIHTKCYQKNHFKQSLKTPAIKIIGNNAYELLLENHFKQHLETSY